MPSKGNTFDEYTRPTPQTFTLRAKNGNTVYLITDNTAPSEVALLTAIGAISGTAQVGSVLTAGALTPSGATATYQWQRADSSNGTFTNISGATASTYTPVSGDVGKYFKVVASGSGTYWDSVTSAATSAVAPIPPIFASGGTITTSGGYRIHTFGPGTYNLTSSQAGTIDVVIDGGGGGGGGDYGSGYCPDPTGDPGGDSSIKIGADSPYIAHGGTGGQAWEDGYCGANGSPGTTTPKGLTGITGGALNGGSGWGGSGGHGGRVHGSITVSSGQVFVITVGHAGDGQCYYECGADGGPGIVTIRYPG